jgi:hypothetical protein
MAVAGEPVKDSQPAQAAAAEEAVEQAVSNEPAKAKPSESWASGASTTDPSPHGGAEPTPTSPHDPAATKTANSGMQSAEPVSDEKLDKVIEAAAEDSGTPEESWMRGKSGEKDRPGDR